MRGKLAALLLAAPFAAFSQETPPAAPPAAQPAAAPEAAPPPPAEPAPAPAAEPPAPAPQAAPPAYPPPPQAAPAVPAPVRPYAAPPEYRPPGKVRDRWYIGFGLGGGGGSAVQSGVKRTFEDLNQGRQPSTAFVNFKVGATLTPRLLLGLDISGIGAVADEGGEKTGVSIANVDVVATFFPREKGLFLRGGLGRSGLSKTREVGGLTLEDSSVDGFNVTGGIGWAFWLLQSFNLTVNLDLSRQWYASNAAGFESSSFGALWLGFDWY